MTLQSVTELTTEPTVGRRYLVPVVHGDYDGKVDFYPVFGVRHSDREYLNFNPYHYHFDGRFLTEKQIRFLFWPAMLVRGLAGQPFTTDVRQPELRNLLCRRRQPDYPIDIAATGFLRLWTAFAGRTCEHDEAGFICPHRRAPLGSLPVVDGVITCPLHGLRIDAATGVVMSTGNALADGLIADAREPAAEGV